MSHEKIGSDEGVTCYLDVYGGDARLSLCDDATGAPDRTWFPSATEAERLAIALIQSTPIQWVEGSLDDPGVRIDYDGEIIWAGEAFSKDYALRFGLALIRAAVKR